MCDISRRKSVKTVGLFKTSFYNIDDEKLCYFITQTQEKVVCVNRNRSKIDLALLHIPDFMI